MSAGNVTHAEPPDVDWFSESPGSMSKELDALDAIIFALADEMQNACEAVAAGDIRNTVFSMRRTDAHLEAKAAIERLLALARLEGAKQLADLLREGSKQTGSVNIEEGLKVLTTIVEGGQGQSR